MRSPHDDFRPLKKVRAVVVRYAARTPHEREQLSERFKNEIFGPTGYRTQVVHNGKRVEELLPAPDDRIGLLREIDRYLRAMVDRMIEHSHKGWEEYAEELKRIGFGDPEEDA